MRNVNVVMLAGASFMGIATVAWILTNAPESRVEEASPSLPNRGATIDKLPTGRNAKAENISKSSTIRFVDVASASGINFSYYGSPSAEHYMTEQNGGGIAVFDYDSDGVLDLFFSNGSHFKRLVDKGEASNELYRATAAFQYDSVTTQAGLGFSGFGQGTAAADFDNDGFTDLFVSYFGRNRLFSNNGDGTFSDTTEISGVGDDRWATSAAFADLNGDGALDLYIVNYVDWKPTATPCFLDSQEQHRKVCSPLDFNGQSDLLLRNNQDGTFSPAEDFMEIANSDAGKGLAVAIIDVGSDSLLDVFVANDTMRNFLYINKGDFSFEDTAVQNGVAFSQDGSLGSSMGIACGDYDRNLLPDLFVTNFAHEVVDAITNLGQIGFATNNSELGLDGPSRAMLNFGVVLADFDLDQWPDLFLANGHLWDSGPGGDEYRMRPNIFRNMKGRRFLEVSDHAGPYFQNSWLGRSVASADLDNDGDADLVVGHLIDNPAILQNESRRAGRSVRLRIIGTRSCRQPLGCRVDVVLADQTRLAHHVPSGESFQATHDTRILVSTGDAAGIAKVTVHWPSGLLESWEQLPALGAVTLIEGTGLTE